MRDGKKPLSEAEMRIERTKLMNARQEERIRDVVKKQEEEQESAVKNTERIVELITKSKENMEAKIEYDRQNEDSHKRDKICLVVLVLLWGLIILYTNYFMGEPASKVV
mmetsp:Transcript_22341/g.27443  ORF Transcript_22341/g.27443 Transcript_22341/m.27443 type:complete len:109 (-) Transcript_22341:902-1228(-)